MDQGAGPGAVVSSEDLAGEGATAPWASAALRSPRLLTEASVPHLQFLATWPSLPSPLIPSKDGPLLHAS